MQYSVMPENHITVEMGPPAQIVPTPTQPLTEPWTGIYVMALIVNVLCCCFPCSYIGTVHIVAARGDYTKGNTILAHQKQRAALGWTITGLVLGCLWLGGLILFCIRYY